MHYLALSFDSPELIVWSVCIGFIIGIVATFAIKQILGKLISLVLDAGANDESSAVSLNDLGQGGNKLLKLCLRVIGINGVFTLVNGEEDKSKSKAKDLENVRFYIESDRVEKAMAMKKGNIKWYFLPIISILLVILAIILVELLPVLTSF